MDRFTEMQTFCAVVDAGSFVKAAEELGVSKAAISRHVAELETRLGVRLLQRTTRRLSLTEEGELFNARCRLLLHDLEEAETEVSARSVEVSGHIRINVPVSFGIKYLAPLWDQFHERYPGVTLQVSLSDQLVDLVAEGFDLAIRISSLSSSSLISRKLASTRMILCASPGYLEKHGRPEQPDDLIAHQTISYSYWAEGNEWRFDSPEGPHSVTIKPWMHSNNGETCVAVALKGQGVVFQPDFLLREYLASGDLIELLPQYKTLNLGIYAIYPSRKHIPSKTRVLMDFLMDALR